MEEYRERFFTYVLLQSPTSDLAAHLESYPLHRHYTSQLNNLELEADGQLGVIVELINVKRLVYTSILSLVKICRHIHRRVSRMIQPHLHIRNVAMIKKSSIPLLITTLPRLQSNQYPSWLFRCRTNT